MIHSTAILIACCVLIWAVMYFTWRYRLKTRKGFILGLTLPEIAHDDRETLAITGSFKKRLNMAMIPLLLMIAPIFLMLPAGRAMILFMIWLLLAIAAPMAVYVMHHNWLLALKQAKNWYSAEPDGDKYWIWGIFYRNPDDGKLFVKNRSGIGNTMNLAKPAGRAMAVFSLICVLSLPFLGFWMWNEERTPIKLVLNESALSARHTGDLYVIPLKTIESVELLDKLPRMIRVGGMSLGNFLKGRFRLDGYGVCRLLLRSGEPPYLVIKSGANTYILSDADSRITSEVYEYLRRR